MSDVKPLTEQEEQHPKYTMTLACLLSQVALVDALEVVDDDQGPFVSERDSVRLANAAYRWFSANNPTLDALRAELAQVTDRADRMTREAMAARKFMDCSPLSLGLDGYYTKPKLGDAYRAVRAENEKREDNL